MTTPYYEDDLVTLYHGDCREVTAWLEADVLVTDPPYGIAWRPNQQWFAWGSGLRAQEGRPSAVMAGDSDTSARDSVISAWGERPAIVFGTWRSPRPTQVRHLLIWHKKGRQPGVTTAPWFPTHEEIYVLGSGFTGGPEASVYATTEHRGRETQRIGHPTSKPTGLMAALIGKCPAGVVADPFTGSGSTLVAAKSEGRRAVGVELDERYCEIAARRLAQDTLFGGAA